MYPIAMVTALEGQPIAARSVLLGLFYQGIVLDILWLWFGIEHLLALIKKVKVGDL